MIRHVREADFLQIEKIRSSFVLDISRLQDIGYRKIIQSTGFVGSFSRTEFDRDIHHLFLVFEDEGVIDGYLRIDLDREYKDDDKRFWLSDDARSDYFEDPHAEIGMIGVRSERKNNKVASQLLNEACEILKKQKIYKLYSLVVISPVTNIPSLIFHEHSSFIRVGISHPHTHFDIKNYQSILYLKQI